jgi:hypothetical protein
MTAAALLPCLLLFLTRLSIGSGYSFNIDTDVKASSKTTYSSGSSNSGLDAGQDFNGDGFNDILICSFINNNAYLFFGGVSGASTTPSVKFIGPASSSFSSGCRYAGDVNKDGFADIIFGAPDKAGGGIAYLVLGGPSTTTPLAVPDTNGRTITYTPGSPNGVFGWSTAAVGDVNKDTFDDFVICATGFDTTLTDVGACFIIYGGSNLHSMALTSLGSGGIRITGKTANQKLGTAITGVGDINKDGYADILIGCGDRKNVYLLYGGPSLTNVDTTSGSFPGVIFPNPITLDDSFGAAVSRAGDFNGDGYDDLVIASVGNTRTSVIYVVFGGSSSPASFDLNTMTSSAGVRYFTKRADNGGWSVSGGVDINSDGFTDIIIGAPNTNNHNGAAHVVFGSASPVDSSVFHLGNGVISLNGTSNQVGSIVTLEKNVGTISRGILVSPFAGVVSPVYYFHDLLEPDSSVSPTTSPTFSPTVPPTVAPTFSPSANPSVFPTIEPSVSPTFTPTRSPSVVPSKGPTVSPTQTPSLVPSVTPTFSPTRSPSVVPSKSPTVSPTQTPSLVPSVTPTFSPTRSPSVVPSESPTVTATQTPTLAPSVDPTMIPSVVPTIVPSFRSSAPIYSPSAVPTLVPSVRTKRTIPVVVNAGFTVYSVNGGATFTPTSQETIKQSIANVSQTTVNNVDLVSVTRTDRRLLLSSSLSVVYRMLASVSLFSYKVVAEIHFNLIDFPGLNESYVAGTKSKVLMQSMESHEFDRIISYYAIINNATQLMSNATVYDVTVTTTIIPAPDDSSSGSKEDLAVGGIVGIVVGVVAGTCLLTVLIYFALVQRRSQSKARCPNPMMKVDYAPERVPHSENAMVDITKVYEDSSDKQFDRFKKLQMTISSSPDVVKL